MSDTEQALYWNAMESMSREELENLQFQRLIYLLKYIQQNSPFYRNRLLSYGVSYQDIKTLEDLIKLPFTSKQDIVHAAEKAEYTYGELFLW